MYWKWRGEEKKCPEKAWMGVEVKRNGTSRARKEKEQVRSDA
jgi:hypothetical protein